jgi:hypothetical protein
MDDRAGPGVAEHAGHEARVGDVAAHERVPRMIEHALDRIEVAGVGQLVEIDDALRRLLGNDLPDKAAANEPGAAGDKDRLLHLRFRRSSTMGVT